MGFPNLRDETAQQLAIAAAVLTFWTTLALLPAERAAADPCVVPDNGGTVLLPPIGCDYLSPGEVHLIISGLPQGSTIELDPIHKDFVCGDSPQHQFCSQAGTFEQCEAPGGVLSGNIDCFESTVEFHMRGTGALSALDRIITLATQTEVHTGPRTPGDPVQTFPSEMRWLRAQLFGVDPDFDFLLINAGTVLGRSGPGQTTLTQRSDGSWNVYSYFDLEYDVVYEGKPGSLLDGALGVSIGSIRMETGDPVGLPGIQDGWLVLLGLLVAGSTILLVIRRSATRPWIRELPGQCVGATHRRSLSTSLPAAVSWS